jgi:hypothetical protein
VAAVAVIALLLALVAGAPTPDLAFAEVVEDWVIDATPPRLRTLEAVADPRTARLVRLLGCPTYDCRELAEEELRRLGEAAARPLIWATRHRDPEVRHRARRLLDELAYCHGCRGTGLGAYRYASGGAWGEPATLHFDDCAACRGTGARP